MESRDGDREEASSEAEKPLMWLLCFCVYDWVVNFIGGLDLRSWAQMVPRGLEISLWCASGQ